MLPGMAESMVFVLSPLRLRVFDPVIECPAGEPIAEAPQGSGCACRVEATVLLAGTDPSSLTAFCLGDHRRCPTWIAEKHRVWAAQKRSLIDGT